MKTTNFNKGQLETPPNRSAYFDQTIICPVSDVDSRLLSFLIVSGVTAQIAGVQGRSGFCKVIYADVNSNGLCVANVQIQDDLGNEEVIEVRCVVGDYGAVDVIDNLPYSREEAASIIAARREKRKEKVLV